MLRFSLRSAGFGITEVATGAEALRRLEDEPPDAVVLDLSLPDGQGEAVLNRLRQNSSRSPVWLAMSAIDHQEAIERFGPLDGHFLAKPFDPWNLVEMLQEMLASQEPTDPSPTDPLKEERVS
jgi:CheY-like chemotaxis protein